jgi:hypothetical protein
VSIKSIIREQTCHVTDETLSGMGIESAVSDLIAASSGLRVRAAMSDGWIENSNDSILIIWLLLDNGV